MADTVFILGAGASARAGAPLMDKFLDTARLVNDTGTLADEDHQHFERVFAVIADLQISHSKSQTLQLHNIESIFTALEMASVLDHLPREKRAQDADAAIVSLRRLILRTLERTVRYPMDGATVTAPVPYGRFADLLKSLMARPTEAGTVAVITFNYDSALDYAVRPQRIRYGIGDDPAGPDILPILKLHGGLNWFRCEHCTNGQLWALRDPVHKHWASPDGRHAFMEIDRHANPLPCNHAICGEPVIVPPSWGKAQHYKELQSVWAAAATELRPARNIFVIGYSMPRTDQFFPMLYSIGTADGPPLERFWVFDPEPSIKRRYEALLGPGARRRFTFFENPKGFDAAISELFDTFLPKFLPKS